MFFELTYEIIITACISFFIGFLISLFFIINKSRKLSQAQLENKISQEKLNNLEKQADDYYSHWQQAISQLEDKNTAYTQLMAQYASLKSTLIERKRHFEEQLNQINHSKQILTKEFENLANKILDEKGKAFKTLNQENIEGLLKPVQGEIKGFREKIESIHTEDLKQRSELKAELLNLQKLNAQITDQADKLTNALQGQKKVQGNWGELMLENVLDNSGLRIGEDYKREVSFTTEEGRKRPDAIVYLPQNKHLVIDAKTSLGAYTRYVNSEHQNEQQEALKQHVLAMTDRINELADKDYYKLPGLNSPEVVVLFVPIESAYVEALKYQPDLYQKAIERNILVATPTTLLTSLNIVRQLWRFEDQSKHTAELAKRAERFYSKLNGFLTSMQGVGEQLDKAKDSYDKSFAQLYSGRGNLIKQAAEFKDLGVSVQKELPKTLIERAHLELEQ